MSPTQSIAAGLMVMVAAAAWAQTQPAATQTDDLYGLTPEQFFKRPELQARISKDHADIPLLEAAVFQQSNRERAAHDLPPFKHSFAMQYMARLHSKEMGSLQYFEHDSPVAENRTLAERLKNVGLVNVTAGENIAVLPAMEMGSGSYLIHKNPDGSETRTDEKNGQTLNYYTYQEMAAAVLQDWMNSPPHRENLMNKEFVYLGVGSARGAYDTNHQDSFYFTQNFTATIKPAGENKARSALASMDATGK